MILVDSSVWVDYFNGVDTPQTSKLDSLLGVEPLGIGDLILTEVLQGFRKDADYKQAKQLLLSLVIFDMLGVRKAVQSAEYFRTLRKQGITIRKTADVIIATFCIEEGHALLFSDRDFAPFVEQFGLREMT
ncbi:MAG: PIN domain nuclease [Bacteroidetes bacterium]|nr:PIN domain nuclease [Bacteroidota bacterium]